MSCFGLACMGILFGIVVFVAVVFLMDLASKADSGERDLD